MYWVSIAVNFALLALFFWMLLKSKLPQMFRDRTNTIQKALKEAHAASAEASRRLGEIEARLSKLDTEVSDIKAGAEREAAAEEERMRAAAEEDKRKVVDAAESEIAAIARSARHELKSFAASLAVDIASQEDQSGRQHRPGAGSRVRGPPRKGWSIAMAAIASRYARALVEVVIAAEDRPCCGAAAGERHGCDRAREASNCAGFGSRRRSRRSRSGPFSMRWPGSRDC